MAGYSGTPLTVKLGLKPGQIGQFINAPSGYVKSLGALPENFRVQSAKSSAGSRLDFVQLFVKDRAELAALLPRLLKQLAPAGMLWVSWPKKASGVPSTVTEDVIRDCALPLGLVDVKVCAVDEVWSGLKLVIRVERR